MSSHIGLPVPNPGLSFWQKSTRAFPHLNANSDAALPTRSRYVIIGSGLAGSLTAFELLEAGVQGKDVIIIEAREAASGASSRNAGHVRPDAFRGFPVYAAAHGVDQSVKILANERLVLHKVDEFVRTHNVPCDFHFTKTFDVCMTPEFADYEAASFNAYKKAGGDVSHVKFYEGAEAKEKTRVPGTVAAYEWPAGSIHPAKLTHWLIRSCVTRGVKLFTHCPVTSVKEVIVQATSDAAQPTLWAVSTARGTVVTSTVVHCTNAHVGYLLPTLEKYVTPCRAQAMSIIPTSSFAGDNVIPHTMSLRYTIKHFHSLVQRPSDGTFILGVSRGNPSLSPKAVAELQTTDDTRYSSEVLQAGIKGWREIFPQTEASSVRHGEGVDHVWTGIIAMSTDHAPFVGPIESLPGQYVCAGFNGHGMARIFTCAPGVVKLIMGKVWSATGLPECFQMSASRLSSLRSLAQGQDPVDRAWASKTGGSAKL
ncbi:hypothetical protein ABEF95_007123 [Exophiala dermatitidis]